jgi:putative transposase
MQQGNKIYLFVHVIWSVGQQAPLLKKPVRTVLFAHIKTVQQEKLVKILAINGVEDHLHCLLQLHPMQNLSQVMKNIKEESSHWLNENKLMETAFEWKDDYAAYSVSPSGIKQVEEYISKQEEHHKTKTLDSELEVFEKMNF